MLEYFGSNCCETRCGGCIAAPSGSRGWGSLPLHLPPCASLTFAPRRHCPRAIPVQPEPFTLLVLCPGKPNKRAGVDWEKSWIPGTGDIRSAPSGMSGHLCAGWNLFSHCSDKDSCVEGTR